MKRLMMFLMLTLITVSVSAQSFASVDVSKFKHEQVMKPYQNEISDYACVSDASVDNLKSEDKQVMKPYQDVILISGYVPEASVDKWLKNKSSNTTSKAVNSYLGKSKSIDLPKFHSKQAQIAYYTVATTFVGLTTLFIVNLLKVSKG